MSSYRFAVLWLKAFRESAEKVCALYADDFLFEDLILRPPELTLRLPLNVDHRVVSV